MATKEDIIKALKKVNDPDIGIDIWTLGFIYNIEIKEPIVNIKMTLTSPMCPYAPMLIEEVKTKVKEIKGISEVNVEMVFDPPWEPSEELRATLGV
ncbi:aromatic ring hydroxylase [archaeon]|jgi:metal-sulfur cluster biosynthetic enzyme|nr:aromatic ring hydroxylase [archaeon]MDP6547574.1 metal-sulfur cluster assembly factor [Candidatus Woesearchaeota archaeon]|tara:strand:- start:52785 stop:53072 length:288 start_codon:yes stop_codon:yes gene_type:complete